MVNTRKKMQRSVAKAKEWLRQEGYFNIHVCPHTRFIKDFIIDGSGFDIIATKSTHLAVIQVKSNKSPSKQIKQAYSLLSKKYGVEAIWINCQDGGAVKVYSSGDCCNDIEVNQEPKSI